MKSWLGQPQALCHPRLGGVKQGRAPFAGFSRVAKGQALAFCI